MAEKIPQPEKVSESPEQRLIAGLEALQELPLAFTARHFAPEQLEQYVRDERDRESLEAWASPEAEAATEQLRTEESRPIYDRLVTEGKHPIVAALLAGMATDPDPRDKYSDLVNEIDDYIFDVSERIGDELDRGDKSELHGFFIRHFGFYLPDRQAGVTAPLELARTRDHVSEEVMISIVDGKLQRRLHAAPSIWGIDGELGRGEITAQQHAELMQKREVYEEERRAQGIEGWDWVVPSLEDEAALFEALTARIQRAVATAEQWLQEGIDPLDLSAAE